MDDSTGTRAEPLRPIRHAMRPYYILNDNNEAIPCDDHLFWAEWFQNRDRHVRLEEVVVEGCVRPNGGTSIAYTVSTVFLGIDHGFNFSEDEGEYQPILFETMIFSTDESEWLNFQMRYRTWAEAEAGHEDAVRRLRSGEILG
jgi:hypothetical protein